jgi:hypothetical protein
MMCAVCCRSARTREVWLPMAVTVVRLKTCAQCAFLLTKSNPSLCVVVK